MKCKTKLLKYFFAVGMALVISCSVYLLAREDGEEQHTPLSKPSDKNNQVKRGPPTLIPNPDGCDITLDNGQCARPGSF